jgi:hypothetical protein
VQRALEEDEQFADKPLKDQKAKMEEYAEEQIAENDEKKDIIPDANKATGLNSDGTPIEEELTFGQPIGNQPMTNPAVKEPVAA